jgi:hypothetical protein
MPSTDDLIDRLTADLEQRRAVSPGAGRAMFGAVALLTMFAVAVLLGMRRDFVAGMPHSVPLMSELMLLCAGCAVAATLTAMARPEVGAVRGGWQWAVAAIAILPVAALVTAAGDNAQRALMLPPVGSFCLAVAAIASIASIVLLTIWLMRGAPTSPTRAAWLVGIAGGTVGAISIGLSCPEDAITHIGTWHVGGIFLAAVVSRLVLPRFLQW